MRKILIAGMASTALVLSACGSTNTTEVAASTPEPTQIATPTPTPTPEPIDPEQQALSKWKGLSENAQRNVCSALASSTKDDVASRFAHTETDEVAALFVDQAATVCDARARAAEREAQQQAERERQYKIDAMLSDSSLTRDQKVAVYDAACEYLTTPGEADLWELGEIAIAALPPGSTPQQQFDASTSAGYLLGTSGCR